MKTLRTGAIAAVAVAALAAVGCGSSDSSKASSTTAAAASASSSASTGTTASGSSSSSTSAAAAAAPEFSFKPLDASGPITKAALKKGDVDIALLFSSDADIAANNWVSLNDDKKLQQLENVVPAIRVDKKTDAVAKALDAVSAKLTTPELVEMNRQNSVDDKTPKDVAAAWLKKNNLVPYTGDKVSGSLTVGSTNFAEQEIVAELYSQILTAADAKISRKFQLGSREVVAPALEKGDIDLYPEYIGSYTLFLDKQARVPADKNTAVAQLNTMLQPKGITVLTPSDAQDTNAFVVTKVTADRYGLKNVSDLAKLKTGLTLGGPPECPERPFCLVGLKQTYGLKFNV
ncbi:MAG: osmoprotectant transport system substrate-binding protein [Acidimicrobiia bacterium]|jgi:osmoprotectant transport system substrate-binding protein|nr:osmoprotectant transport system substrate-binding protein [Acidimicrobiia bacterium]